MTFEEAVADVLANTRGQRTWFDGQGFVWHVTRNNLPGPAMVLARTMVFSGERKPVFPTCDTHHALIMVCDIEAETVEFRDSRPHPPGRPWPWVEMEIAKLHLSGDLHLTETPTGLLFSVKAPE